jgi:hypothetical protein
MPEHLGNASIDFEHGQVGASDGSQPRIIVTHPELPT